MSLGVNSGMNVIEGINHFLTGLKYSSLGWCPWSMWLSIACAASRGHVDIHCPCCHRSPCWCCCLWFILPPKAMLMPMVQRAMVMSVVYAETILMFMVHFNTRRQMDVQGQGCHLWLYWWPWNILPLKTTLMSMVCDTAKGHGCVLGLWSNWDHNGAWCHCYNLAPCWCLWAVLPLESMLKWSTLLLAVKGNGGFLLHWYQWLQTHNWEWETCKLLWQDHSPTTPPKKVV